MPDSKKIISMRMPSEVELADHARRQLAAVKATYIENWPHAVAALSIPTAVLPLDFDEVDSLITGWSVTWGGSSENLDALRFKLDCIAHRIDAAIAGLGGSCFVRLGSRSPKDSHIFEQGQGRVETGADAVQMLVTSMERVYADLAMARRAGYQPTICARKFLNLVTRDREFRVFIEDGAIVGITQYHNDEGPFPWVRDNAASIERLTRDFIEKWLQPLMHLQSYTVDLVFDDALAPTMLEINPPVSLGHTYPGLFRDKPLDGSFQFL